MSRSLDIFHTQYESLKSLIQTADVFANLKLDSMRGKSDSIEVVRKVVEEGGTSHLRHSKWLFMSKEEQKEFESQGHIKDICQQVVLASYTVLESYMVNMFKELLSKRVKDEELNSAILKNISFRSLKWIKNHYSSFLNISLPDFNHEQVPFYTESCFQAQSVWEGVILLSELRNEIAHEGVCNRLNVSNVVDAYSVMEFVQYWVILFDARYSEKFT